MNNGYCEVSRGDSVGLANRTSLPPNAATWGPAQITVKDAQALGKTWNDGTLYIPYASDNEAIYEFALFVKNSEWIYEGSGYGNPARLVLVHLTQGWVARFLSDRKLAAD